MLLGKHAALLTAGIVAPSPLLGGSRCAAALGPPAAAAPKLMWIHCRRWHAQPLPPRRWSAPQTCTCRARHPLLPASAAACGRASGKQILAASAYSFTFTAGNRSTIMTCQTIASVCMNAGLQGACCAHTPELSYDIMEIRPGGRVLPVVEQGRC